MNRDFVDTLSQVHLFIKDVKYYTKIKEMEPTNSYYRIRL